MKPKKYIILSILAFFSNWVIGQNEIIIDATSKDNIYEQVSKNKQYLLPDFSNGVVYFNDSQQAAGKLNYNVLIGEMHFISPNNEILALDNVPNVRMITIGERTFYHYKDKEFVETILVTDKMELQARRKSNLSAMGKKGAYGGYSSTSSIRTYSGLAGNSQIHDLSVSESMSLIPNDTYFLVLNGKRILIKNQQTFVKQFPNLKDKIEAFVKENDTHFDNEDNMIALVNYCSTL